MSESFIFAPERVFMGLCVFFSDIENCNINTYQYSDHCKCLLTTKYIIG